MGLAKPTGGYAEQMLVPGGWPDVDEQAYYDRAQEYLQVLRQVTDVLEACQSQRTELFDAESWSGTAAGAANGQLGTLIDGLVTLQNGLATVITWHKYVAQTIVQAKSDVIDNVVEAHRTIASLEKDSSLDEAERTQQINTVVTTTLGANVSIVDGTAAQIMVSKSWKPPANALQDLLDQKTPPPVNIPDGPAPTPSPFPTPRPTPVTPGGGGLTPPTPGGGGLTPPTPGGGGLGPLTPPLDGGGLQPSPGPSPVGPLPTPAPVGPAGPVGPPAPLGPAAPAVPLSPAAGLPQPGAGPAGGPKGVTPASASGPGVMPASVAPGEEAAGAHAGAGGVPAGPMGAGGAGGAGGSGGSGGPGGRSGASAAEKAADKSASSRPAATARGSGKSKPRAQPMHPDRADVGEAIVATAAAIPVSAARIERDALAAAATADAARRAGPDPLQLARRIGAALNAPDMGGNDLGFFWVTGVTAEGAIVVANSYGLAYIPDGVELPEKVYLASADETIPAGERARWATYPVMAVQGWAAHHEMELRAVIGTEEQLANSDAGVATIVLQPDDIPDTGDMIGRPRLAVVDSEAAERLAATPDTRLADLLPPPPEGAEPAVEPQPEPRPESAEVVEPEVAEVLVTPGPGRVRMGDLLAQMPLPSADAGAPAPGAPSDDRFMLWFEVMKPMASDASGRQAAHLQAFQAYAAHAEEVLLREAHTTIDPDEQRTAVADWMYWKYIGELINAALAEAPVLAPA
ncbi:secretion protein EspK [Mycobacterium sp. 050128]|uniref:secretion protein EspK n=1 Tax=Mycobacterium sp. 050128 TaxID=3096112 RepID=UPI002ED7D8D1